MFIQMLGSFKLLSTLLVKMYLRVYSCILLIRIIVGALQCGKVVVITAWHSLHVISVLSFILKPCDKSSAYSWRKSIWVMCVLRVATAVHRWTNIPCCIPQYVIDRCDSGEACPILTCKLPVKWAVFIPLKTHWQNCLSLICYIIL